MAQVWNKTGTRFITDYFAPLTPPAAAPVEMPDMEHFCAPVVYPKTSEVITKYHCLANNPDSKLHSTRKMQ